MATNKKTRKRIVAGKTIYHVKIGDKNTYFGSIAAIYDKHTPEELGITKTSLWTYGIKIDKPYQNKLCTIYKGELHRKKGNRRKEV